MGYIAKGLVIAGAGVLVIVAVSRSEPAAQLDQMQRRTLPRTGTPTSARSRRRQGVAGRDSNAKVLNAVAARVPWLVGGSADLAPSNKSRMTFDGAGDF